MSLISQTDKDTLAAVFKSSVFDTFKRSITVYQEAQKLVVSTNPNFTRFNRGNQNAINPQNVPVSQTISACILYDKKQENPMQPIGNTPQQKLRITEGMVRIQIEPDDYSFFSKAKKVELDGQLFDVDSVERAEGLFGAELYTFWLKRVQ